VTEASHAVFLSYASQDAEAAQRICAALRAAGIEVFLDQSELRGGDAWDQKIRREIHDCALFIPVISAHTAARHEGYFRLEWDLADQRTHMIARNRVFVVPVSLDATPEATADVPESFQRVQWTRLPGGETPPAFVERVRKLVSPETSSARAPETFVPAGSTTVRGSGTSMASPWRSKLALWATGALLASAIAYFAVDKLLLSKSAEIRSASKEAMSGPLVSDKSIAVLPFVDLSEKRDQEYFADGLAEEVLELLSKIPGLKVTGRTSSFQFKGKNQDLRQIGNVLGVTYVVEGSVRRSGERLRVTAQLISTRDGTHLWSNTYDRPYGDVLTLQDELAAGVARAMEVAVDSDTLQSHAGTHNPDAYDFYLRGLHSMERYDRDGFETGANYFQQALDLDPNFAAAATQLGRMVIFQAEWAFVPAGPAYARARRSLQTAIKLDPGLGQAHAWLGWIYMAYDWNWSAADSEMREALRLAPRDPVVHLCAARLAASLGRLDEAIDLITSGLARDPLYAAGMNSLSEVYARAGRLADAEAAERRVLEISPTYSSGPRNLAVVLLALGRAAEALNIVRSMQQDTVDRAQALALTYYDLGRQADSDQQMAVLVRRYANDDAFSIAETYAYRGQGEQALQWLERAKLQKDSALYFIKTSMLFKKLEPDPRYRAFLRGMNLLE